jgi:hypothetical protein
MIYSQDIENGRKETMKFYASNRHLAERTCLEPLDCIRAVAMVGCW